MEFWWFRAIWRSGSPPILWFVNILYIIPTYPSNPPTQQRVSTQLKNLWISRLGSSYQLPMNQLETFEARKQSLRSESYGQSLGEYWKFWSQSAEHSSGCPQKCHSPRLDFMIYDREYQAKHIISEQSLVSKTPHFSSNVAGKATYEKTGAVTDWVLPSQQTASWAYLSTATKSV